MKNLIRTAAILCICLAFTGIAAAAGPTPGAFSTTGYTTNVMPLSAYPYIAPLEFAPLPNNYAKFHFEAQGGPGVDDDATCLALYGAPCAALCAGFGEPCGAHGAFEGAFTFDEWGVVDTQTFAGANHGLMTITTATGQADVRFGGIADSAIVTGAYAFLDGAGDYKGLRGQGAYTGNAGLVFKVDYAPCGGKGGPACPAPACAIFGDDLKLKKDKAEWKITNNNGEDAVTISQVTVFWPEGQGALTKVKLGGKTIYDGMLPAPSAQITTGWRGKNGDRRIAAGKAEELRLEFDAGDISAAPWDYTILVEFAEGCAVPFVAFAPQP